MPASIRATPADPTSRNATGAFALEAFARAGRAEAGARRTGFSSNEFQASHWGQRPSQRGDSKPQAEQKKTARDFAMFTVTRKVLRGHHFA
jgi:hypothetical protein